MDDYGSIAFTGEYAEGILLVAEEYFEAGIRRCPTRVPTWTFCDRWCPTSGPGGAELTNVADGRGASLAVIAVGCDSLLDSGRALRDLVAGCLARTITGSVGCGCLPGRY